MNRFTTPCDHVGFVAKRLFGTEKGKLSDGAIAYIEPNGGGPLSAHTHTHDHLFIVVCGEISVRTPDATVIYRANEAVRVAGSQLHSIWNTGSEQAIVVGLNLTDC